LLLVTQLTYVVLPLPCPAPPRQLPRAQEPTCEVVWLEGGAGALVARVDLQIGDWLTIAPSDSEDDSSDEEDGDDEEENDNDDDSDDNEEEEEGSEEE
jgi:hypothetical protein